VGCLASALLVLVSCSCPHARSAVAAPGGDQLAACGGFVMAADVAELTAATGTVAAMVRLVNTSSTACSVIGYPNLDYLSGAGDTLPVRVTDGGDPLGATNIASSPVALASGAGAEFALVWSEVGPDCTTTTAVAIGIGDGASARVEGTGPDGGSLSPCSAPRGQPPVVWVSPVERFRTDRFGSPTTK
jgi:hypothetical protein